MDWYVVLIPLVGFGNRDDGGGTFEVLMADGWICLACDWWHGVPQLFWKAAIDVTLPDSCAMVELVPAGV